MTTPILLGTHVSISGGIHTAFSRATAIGCTTMQVFTKNANRWTAKALTDSEVRDYASARKASSVEPVFAHAAYLINLCATNPETLQRSRVGLGDELGRCEALGLRGLIVHPGTHGGHGEEVGIHRVAESIDAVHAKTPGFKTLTVLETTAGQGSALGYRFEQLRAMLDLIDERQRVAVCVDTCHLFAAGYDIGTAEGWESVMAEFDAIIGLDRLVAIHVNDSKKERGSRVDRHEHIGKGRIGLAGFSSLMNDPRLAGVPKILETDKSDDMHEDVENLTLLRSLVR